MSFQGERRQGVEFEHRPSVTVQFAYIPIDIQSRYRAIPQVEEAAERFFSSDVGSANIMAIEAPQIPGLNIPHFVEWQRRTGKYFEGYAQHTRTGFFRNRPLGRKQLAQLRETTEEALQTSIHGVGEDEMLQMYFFGSLLMLDRLAGKVPFTLAIEPRTARGVIDLVRSGKRLQLQLKRKGSEESNEPFRSRGEVEEFVEEVRRERTSEYGHIAGFLGEKVGTFHSFLNDVVGASKSVGQTKIFVPRESLYYAMDRQWQQTDETSTEYRTPQVIGDEIEQFSDGHIIARFIKDSSTEISRIEAIRDIVMSLIAYSMGTIQSGSYERNLSIFLNKTTPDELENAVFASLLADDILEGQIALLNFFGEKTSGSRYGDLLGFVTRFHQDGELRNVFSGLARELGERLTAELGEENK